MARQFLDTSSVVKLCHAEPMSAGVRAFVGRNDALVISGVTDVELRSAFYRLVRLGQLSAADVAAAVASVGVDANQYAVAAFTSATIANAVGLVETYAVSHGLRCLDAIQLASALESHAIEPLDSFISTDNVQRTVAAAEGLTVLP